MNFKKLVYKFFEWLYFHDDDYTIIKIKGLMYF